MSALDRWDEVYVRRGVELGEDRGMYIVALSEEKVYGLSPAAYFVWALCDGSTTLGTIVENIAEHVPEKKVEALYTVVTKIIDELLEAGLVAKASEKASAS